MSLGGAGWLFLRFGVDQAGIEGRLTVIRIR
jgi:hypothetical protein